MIKKFLVIAAILFFSSNSYAQILRYCDFESDTCGLNPQGTLSLDPNNKREISTDRARSGSRSLKMARGSVDCDSTGNYDECAHVQFSFDQVVPFQFNTEYWIGGSFFVPSGTTIPARDPAYADRGNYISLEDMHGMNCPDYFNQTFMHFLAPESNPNHQFYVHGSTSCSFQYEGDFSVNATLGVWHDFVINIKISSNGAGKFIYWLDTVQLFSVTSANIGFTDAPPYYKFGIYLPKGPATIYWDEMRIGDANSSFEEVSPGGGTPDPDTEAPNLSGGYARTNSTNYYSTLPQGTTSADFHVIASESSTVKYSTTTSTAWGDMSAVTGNSGLDYYITRGSLSDGNTYTTCFLAQDAAENESDEYCFSVTVDSEGGGGTNLLNDNTYVSATGAQAIGTGWCYGQLFHDGVVDGNEYPNSICNSWANAEHIDPIYNLGNPYDLTTLRFYGTDSDGGWGCSTYTFQVDKGSGFASVFTGRSCSAVGWDEIDLAGTYGADVEDVIGVKFIINGYEAGGGTQAQEAELFGTLSSGEDPPTPPIILSGSVVFGSSLSPNFVSGNSLAADIIFTEEEE